MSEQKPPQSKTALPGWVGEKAYEHAIEGHCGSITERHRSSFIAGARLVLERLEKVSGVPAEPVLRQLYRDYTSAYCAGRESVRKEVLE